MPDTPPTPYRARLLGTFEITGDRDFASSTAWRSQQNRTILKMIDDAPHYPPQVYAGRLFEIPYSLGHTPFVGREHEYAWLIARWRGARPGLILVEGEAGVGKTRLVEEALGFAATQGAHDARAFPLPEGTAAPYGTGPHPQSNSHHGTHQKPRPTHRIDANR